MMTFLAQVCSPQRMAGIQVAVSRKLCALPRETLCTHGDFSSASRERRGPSSPVGALARRTGLEGCDDRNAGLPKEGEEKGGAGLNTKRRGKEARRGAAPLVLMSSAEPSSLRRPASR